MTDAQETGPVLDAEVTAEFARTGLDVATIFPVVYEELRRIAHGYFRGNEQTLQPTSLVHEAFLRLAQSEERGALRINSKSHFCALAATAMRQILVDRARRRLAQKRGGGEQQLTLTGVGTGAPDVDVIDLDRALSELAARDPRQARIVELRYFGGLTVEEIAEHLSVSTSTVEKSWRGARAWLAVRIQS